MLMSSASKDPSNYKMRTKNKNLRRKLGARGHRIATVYGIGYKFDPRG